MRTYKFKHLTKEIIISIKAENFEAVMIELAIITNNPDDYIFIE